MVYYASNNNPTLTPIASVTTDGYSHTFVLNTTGINKTLNFSGNKSPLNALGFGYKSDGTIEKLNSTSVSTNAYDYIVFTMSSQTSMTGQLVVS